MRFHPLSSVADPDTVALSRRAFGAHLHDLLIQCQPGYDLFLADGRGPAESEYWVATEKAQTVGFAEFRRSPDGVTFLNHLAVAPQWQRQGVARELLGAYASAHQDAEALALDVFLADGAVGFYERLGLAQAARSSWSVRPITLTTSLPGQVGVRPAARHALVGSLSRYGFGTIEVEYAGHAVRIGFPSKHTVRLTGPAAFDPAFVAGLGEKFPQARTVVQVGEWGDAAVPGGMPIARMRGDFSAVRAEVGV